MSRSINNKSVNVADQAETRGQLLAAAAAVFAEVGFRNATVRDICRKAGANVASVNYHFGDKETLYHEVLRHAYGCALAKHPPDHGVKANTSAPERLRAFVHSFLLRIFDEGAGAWHGKLLAREMVDPTSALDALVRERIRPQAEMLRGIVKDLLGARADEERVRLGSMSVVSQCLFYHHCRAVIVRIFPGQKFDLNEINKLAEHITQFSLAALKHTPALTKAPIRKVNRLLLKHS